MKEKDKLYPNVSVTILWRHKMQTNRIEKKHKNKSALKSRLGGESNWKKRK